MTPRGVLGAFLGRDDAGVITDTAPPHGHCQCDYDGCASCGHGHPGPAAYEVTRSGVTLRVCTRCDLSADRQTRKVLVRPDEQLGIYDDWDELGGYCLRGHIEEAQS